MAEKYNIMGELVSLGFLANAFDPHSLAGDGDRGCSFPRSDAEDMSRGARFIPGEVTLARRRGERVEFIQECGPCCWYWLFPSGDRHYHWDGLDYENIARANGQDTSKRDKFGYWAGVAGACNRCGNVNTNGGLMPKGVK